MRVTALLYISCLTICSHSTAGDDKSCAVQGCAQTPADEQSLNDGSYSGTLVTSPIGAYIYIKHGSTRCAIKFFDQKIFRSRRPPGHLSSGAPSTGASYHLLSKCSGEESSNCQALRSSTGTVTSDQTYGLGWIIMLRFDSPVFQCGLLTLRWQYPSGVYYYVKEGSDPWKLDHRLQMAVTNITESRKIDFDRADIRWYTSIEADLNSGRVHPARLPN